MFFKIGILKNFAIFTGEQLFESLFVIKVWRPATLLKRDSNAEYCESFEKNFSYRTLLVAAFDVLDV